jgi:hypothetical protein
MPIYMNWTKPGEADLILPGDVVIDGLDDWPDTADNEVKLEGYEGWVELKSAGSINLTRTAGGAEKPVEDPEEKKYEDLKSLLERSAKAVTETDKRKFARRVEQDYHMSLDKLREEMKKLEGRRKEGRSHAQRTSGVGRDDQTVLAAQPPTIESMTVEKEIDGATSKLLEWATKPGTEGKEKQLFEAHIHVVRGMFGSTGLDKRGPSIHPSVKLRLMGCYVQKYDISVNSGEEMPTEHVTIQPNGVKITYYEFNELGQLKWQNSAKYTVATVDASTAGKAD